MIDRAITQLSVRTQCELLKINRNRLGPPKLRCSAEDLKVCRQIDEIHLEAPSFGSRNIRKILNRDYGRKISRAVLSWKLSNTLDTRSCLEALNEAVRSAGKVPEIFNTDQGSQFTSGPWRQRLQELGVKISMDGKRRWMDNVFIQRLWRSVK